MGAAVTDEKRCATCRHWLDRAPVLRGPLGLVATCDVLGRADDVPYVPGSRAYVATPERFGCVLWEAKP